MLCIYTEPNAIEIYGNPDDKEKYNELTSHRQTLQKLLSTKSISSKMLDASQIF